MIMMNRQSYLNLDILNLYICASECAVQVKFSTINLHKGITSTVFLFSLFTVAYLITSPFFFLFFFFLERLGLHNQVENDVILRLVRPKSKRGILILSTWGFFFFLFSWKKHVTFCNQSQVNTNNLSINLQFVMIDHMEWTCKQ